MRQIRLIIGSMDGTRGPPGPAIVSSWPALSLQFYYSLSRVTMVTMRVLLFRNDSIFGFIVPEHKHPGAILAVCASARGTRQRGFLITQFVPRPPRRSLATFNYSLFCVD